MGKKHGSKKNIIVATGVLLIVAFSGYSYEQGLFPDTFYPGEKDEIMIGAFNIQVFGTTKASDENVMNIISDIINRYDIVAIGEIRDSSGTAIQSLMEDVRDKNPAYDYVVSERLGRTSSKEQYAYIYNTEKVVLKDTPQTYPEEPGTDPFHREPFIASFETVEGSFIATFAVIHTDPDEAEEEIDALTDVAGYCMDILPEDEPVIIMGDFNADCSYFDEDASGPLRAAEYSWLTGNELDTTTKSTVCTYDRIVVAGDYTKYYSGESGVLHFDELYNLDRDTTEDVSDHYPVYAVFYTEPKGISDITGSFNGPAETGNTEICDSCSAGAIEITGINPADEWVTISNTGDAAVNMTNWGISNSAGTHYYIFPVVYIDGGDTITLYSGYGENSDYSYFWNSGDDIWDDTGDTAELIDEKGNIVSRFGS